jgi:hypothetical protein
MLGLLLWTPIEYCMHRYFLHSHDLPLKVKRWHRHFHHHGTPKNPNEVVFNVFFSFPILLLGFCLFVLGSGSSKAALLIFPGFLCGYLAYEWVHIGAHFHHTSNFLWLGLYRNHRLHHHKNDSKHFGVTTALWDHIFRTN